MSERVRGPDAIAASWRQLFSSGVRLQIDRSQIHRTQDALLAIHIQYEHLQLADNDSPRPAIIATNIYQLIEGSWRMILHHASPAPDSTRSAAQSTADKQQYEGKLH
jgi:hypothetical protein